jgi:N-dimethylarginine dimethylaminohydrolase
MYHPPAFDFDSRMAIESRIPPEKRIIVDTEDAGNFACNAVNITNKVILNAASSHLQKELEKNNFEVVKIDLSEFLKAGGSAKCLTLKLIDTVASVPDND